MSTASLAPLSIIQPLPWLVLLTTWMILVAIKQLLIRKFQGRSVSVHTCLYIRISNDVYSVRDKLIQDWNETQQVISF